MKLERLDVLNLISTKNVIVNEVLGGLENQFYYNKFQLEINLALVIFTLCGNTEIHKEMAREDIDWVEFVNTNYALIEELKAGEYKDAYMEIMEEILVGAKAKIKYNNSIAGIVEGLKEALKGENLEQFKELIEKTTKSIAVK